MTTLKVAKTRKQAYEAMEQAGEAQDAVWDALTLLLAKEKNIPPAVKAVLDKRTTIKQKYPK